MGGYDMEKYVEQMIEVMMRYYRTAYLKNSNIRTNEDRLLQIEAVAKYEVLLTVFDMLPNEYKARDELQNAIKREHELYK